MIMDSEFKKIKKLIKLMRNEGVLALKQGETEISLSPASLFPKRIDAAAEDIQTIEPQYNDEALIDWSGIVSGLETQQ